MSGIISDVMVCLEAIKALHEAYCALNNLENNNYTRLADRCAIFENSLNEIKVRAGLSKENANRVKPIEEKAVKVLRDTLVDVKEYLSKCQPKKTNKLKDNRVTRFAYRLSSTEELVELNARLNACAIDLNVVQDINAAKHREEDLQDLKSTFALSVQTVLEDIREQHKFGQHTEQMVIELKEDIAQYQSGIAELMVIMSHHDPLTPTEQADITSAFNKLAHDAEACHVAIMSKLSVMDGKIDILLQKLITMAPLTPDQEDIRTSALRELVVLPSSVTVGRMIGHGGFGSVFAGTYQNRQVAIKIILLDGNGPAKLKGAENEIFMMKQLSSPLILSVYGYVKQKTELQIILDYACHKSLDLLLLHPAASTFPFSLCLVWMRDLIEALKYIHSKGIKHRDVKPGNLLVFHNFHLKLSDFGHSKVHSDQHSVGGIVGTLVFMAPEIREGKPSDFAADIYSWAVTAINILTRKVPDVDMNMISQAVAAVESLAIAERLGELLSDCLQYDPHVLPGDIRPSAEQVLRRLNKMLQAEQDPRSMKTKAHRQMIKGLESLLSIQDDDEAHEGMKTGMIDQGSSNSSQYVSQVTHFPDIKVAEDQLTAVPPYCAPGVADGTFTETVAFPPEILPDKGNRLTSRMTVDLAFRTLLSRDRPMTDTCLDCILSTNMENVPLTAEQCGVLMDTLCVYMELYAADPTDMHMHTVSLACKTVSKLTAYVNKISFAGSDGVDVILTVMRTFNNNAKIVKDACSALYNLADIVDNRATVAKAGGIDTIISAMQAHADRAGIVQDGCATLLKLADNDAHKVTIAQGHGVDIILSAMRAHANHVGIIYHGCATLGKLADNCKNKITIAQAGGIHTIISAMRAHAGHPGVSVEGCAALLNFADTDEHKAAIVEAGGIITTLNAVRAHAGHIGIVYHGCGTLGKLACNAGNVVTIAKVGGIDVILSAMNAHADHVGVVQEGCAALLYLADNDENKVAIVEAGGIDTILSTMRAHAGHAGIVYHGCATLGKLADNAKNKITIAQAGGIHTIISAMRAHAGHAGVSVEGSAALRKLEANSL